MPKLSARQLKNVDIITEAEAQAQYSAKGNDAGNTAPSNPINGQIW